MPSSGLSSSSSMNRNGSLMKKPSSIASAINSNNNVGLYMDLTASNDDKSKNTNDLTLSLSSPKSLVFSPKNGHSFGFTPRLAGTYDNESDLLNAFDVNAVLNFDSPTLENKFSFSNFANSADGDSLILNDLGNITMTLDNSNMENSSDINNSNSDNNNSLSKKMKYNGKNNNIVDTNDSNNNSSETNYGNNNNNKFYNNNNSNNNNSNTNNTNNNTNNNDNNMMFGQNMFANPMMLAQHMHQQHQQFANMQKMSINLNQPQQQLSILQQQHTQQQQALQQQQQKQQALLQQQISQQAKQQTKTMLKNVRQEQKEQKANTLKRKREKKDTKEISSKNNDSNTTTNKKQQQEYQKLERKTRKLENEKKELLNKLLEKRKKPVIYNNNSSNPISNLTTNIDNSNIGAFHNVMVAEGKNGIKTITVSESKTGFNSIDSSYSGSQKKIPFSGGSISTKTSPVYKQRATMIKHMLQAFNTGSIEEFPTVITKTCHEECQLVTSGIIESLQGHIKLTKFWSVLVETFPDALIDIVSINPEDESGDRIELQWKFEGTQIAFLPGDHMVRGLLGASGTDSLSKSISITGRCFFTFKGDKISKMICMWSGGAFMLQRLGFRLEDLNRNRKHFIKSFLAMLPAVLGGSKNDNKSDSAKVKGNVNGAKKNINITTSLNSGTNNGAMKTEVTTGTINSIASELKV